MKTSKKILLGLSSLLVLALVVTGFLARQPKVQADHVPEPPLTVTNARFLDSATIIANINDNPVRFWDEDVSGGNPIKNYTPQDPPQAFSDVFCGTGIDSYGINLLATQPNQPQNANIRLGYFIEETFRGTVRRVCHPLVSAQFTIANSDLATASYRWQNEDTFTSVNGNETFNVSSNPNGRGFLRDQQASLCETTGVVVLTSGQYPDLSRGNLYVLSANPRTGRVPVPQAAAVHLQNAQQCSLSGGPTSVTIAPLANDPTQPPPDCDTATDPNCVPGEVEPTCESSYNSGFEWAMCPIFKMADGIAGALLNIFIDLLSFRIDEEYEETVKPAWNVIKNIASGLVVIVMLVMVISTAIGRGPFA